MPVFRYQALSESGEPLNGEMESGSREAVAARLQEAGHYPMRIEAIAGLAGAAPATTPGRSRAPRRRRVSSKDVSIFTRELATLLGAGMPLDRSLQILNLAGPSTKARRLADDVLNAVRGGATFAAALDAQGGVFSRMYVSTVRAGEAGGSLETVLNRLADYLEKSRELRDTVISALIYPAILLVVAVLALILLLTQVVPQFSEMFADAGAALPLPTQIVMTVGAWFTDYLWLMALGLAGLIISFQAALQVPAFRYQVHRVALALPLVGDLVRKVEVARFSRTLGTLLENGVTMLTALGIVGNVLTNRVIAGEVGRLAEGLKEGQGLAEPLAQSGLFPGLAVQMVQVGEETGQMEAMLLKVADVYDREVQVTIKRLLALLEPVVILGLGVLIAGIIISVLMAVLSVNELAL